MHALAADFSGYAGKFRRLFQRRGFKQFVRFICLDSEFETTDFCEICGICGLSLVFGFWVKSFLTRYELIAPALA